MQQEGEEREREQEQEPARKSKSAALTVEHVVVHIGSQGALQGDSLNGLQLLKVSQEDAKGSVRELCQRHGHVEPHVGCDLAYLVKDEEVVMSQPSWWQREPRGEQRGEVLVLEERQTREACKQHSRDARGAEEN